MRNKIIYVVILLVSLSLQSIAQKFQPGYIITDNLDTVYGLVANNNFIENGKFCQFRKTDSSEVTAYQPSEVASYRLTDGKYYISKEVIIDSLRQRVFLEYLIKGKANIFYLRNPNGEYYFIQKENDTLVSLSSDEIHLANNQMTKSKKYTGTMKYILKDAPQLYNEIDKSQLDHKSLIKIAKDYQNVVCKDESCLIYEKKTKSKIGLAISSVIGTYKYYSASELGKTKWNKIGLLSYGITLEVSLPQLNERIGFKPSLLYGKSKFSITDVETKYVSVSSSYSTSDIEIPLMIQYKFILQKKYLLYFNLGPYLDYSFLYVEESYYYDSFSDIKLKTNLDQTKSDYLSLGAGASLGTKIMISKKIYIDMAATSDLLFRSGGLNKCLINGIVSIGYCFE